MNNHKSYVEEGQKIQWQKEKGQNKNNGGHYIEHQDHHYNS